MGARCFCGQGRRYARDLVIVDNIKINLATYQVPSTNLPLTLVYEYTAVVLGNSSISRTRARRLLAMFA